MTYMYICDIYICPGYMMAKIRWHSGNHTFSATTKLHMLVHLQLMNGETHTLGLQ